MGFSEGKRKGVHIAALGWALLMRWLDWRGAVLMALGALLYNIFVLPRLHGAALIRDSERGSSRPFGIIAYAGSVLALVLIFRQALHVAAAGWAVMALGDGVATLAGRAWGRRRLPWNGAKTWLGSLAFVTAGSLGAFGLAAWVAPPPADLWRFAFAALAAALIAAWVESLPLGIDDNISVPFTAAGVFALALSLDLGRLDAAFLARAWVGLGVALATGVLAYAAGSVDASGLAAGVVVGGSIWAGLGWRGYVLLAAFFVLASTATKLGYAQKAARGLAQERGGRRSARHALANGTVAAVAALGAALTPCPLLFTAAFVGALATALADTMSSEVGKRYGRSAWLPTSFRRVAVGSAGAVSVEGTAAGAVAAALLAAGAALSGLVGVGVAAWGAAAGVAGNYLESVAGALWSNQAELENETMNFLNTLAGALLAAAAVAWFGA